MKKYALLLMLFLSCLPFAIGHENLESAATPLLLLYFVAAVASLLPKDDLRYFFTPVSLIFFYSVVSLLLGSWGFAHGYVHPYEHYLIYKRWEHYDLSLGLMLLSLTFFFGVERYLDHRYEASSAGLRTTPRARNLWLVLCLLSPAVIVYVDMEQLNSLQIVGELIVQMRFAFICLLVLYASRFPPTGRLGVYGISLLVLAMNSISDKRNAMLAILPVVYVELMRKKVRLGLRTFLTTIAVGLSLLTIILLMSIVRGYGNFGKMESLVDAIPFLRKYLSSELFYAGLLNNIEAVPFFLHGLSSIEHILKDPSLVSFGSTFAKVFFIIFPRDLGDIKPDSIITLYTTVQNWKFRMIGGSWPISIFSEFIWNFWIFGVLGAGAFAYVLVRFQLLLQRLLRSNQVFRTGFALTVYLQLLILARGSGLDLFTVGILVGASVFFGGWRLTSFTENISALNIGTECASSKNQTYSE